MESAFKQMLNQANKLISGQKKNEAQLVYEIWLQKELENPKLDEKINSRIALVYNNIGHLKYLNVDFDGATEAYDKALKLNPELAIAYFNRGTISYRMGYFDKALGDLVKANVLSPGNPEFQLGLESTKTQLKAMSELK